MQKLRESVAIVTGGASGIGAATARTLAKHGARVIVCDQNGEAGQEIAEDISGTFVSLDVTDEESWEQVLLTVHARFDRVDVLVNAAGIVGDVINGTLDKITLADWRRVLSANLDGTFLGCREAMKFMLPQGSGSIVNVSSVGAYYPTMQNAAYGASKGGVTSLTKSVAMFGSQEGARVRCNSVHPGQIVTPMLSDIKRQKIERSASLPGNKEDPAIKWDSMDRLPLGLGEPEDVSNLVAFLASEDSRYVTGSEYVIDGGWHLLR